MLAVKPSCAFCHALKRKTVAGMIFTRSVSFFCKWIQELQAVVYPGLQPGKMPRYVFQLSSTDFIIGRNFL